MFYPPTTASVADKVVLKGARPCLTLLLLQRREPTRGKVRAAACVASGKMPAVIYGANKPAQSLTLIRKDFEHMLENEACFSSILEVQVGGESENAIIKDIQRHPQKAFQCTPTSFASAWIRRSR